MELKYDRSLFTADAEVVKLDDKKLSNVWGNEVVRVSLKACKLQKSGTYSLTVIKK